ncbi:MAG TPA: lipid-A-disaccharide synthase-related protein [Candidatus Xenobia bacterium]|jgi:uncharacterized protein (TIGR03492 family)
MILFLSNGHGEDTIASGIIRRVRAARPDLPVQAMPLVGHGHAYRRAGVPLLGPQELLPSGGLIHAGMSHFVDDLRSGLIGLTVQQIRALRRTKAQVVAVGDVFPVVLGGLFCQRPLLFVGTARSDWFVPYSRLETRVFRWLCRRMWARDEPTARTMAARGVQATWVGNAMMDCIEGADAALPMLDEGGALGAERPPVIAVLPGSRQATYTDFPVLLQAAFDLGGQYTFVAALAGATPVDEVLRVGQEAGWQGTRLGPAPVVGRLSREGTTMWLTQEALGTVLQRCHLVLGQAGTANEQAAGLGRPVVAFDSQGRATPGWYRARQKGLLGDALRLVPRSGSSVAAAVRDILQKPSLYAHMQETGQARMGPPGASAAMAREILDLAAGGL